MGVYAGTDVLFAGAASFAKKRKEFRRKLEAGVEPLGLRVVNAELGRKQTGEAYWTLTFLSGLGAHVVRAELAAEIDPCDDGSVQEVQRRVAAWFDRIRNGR